MERLAYLKKFKPKLVVKEEWIFQLLEKGVEKWLVKTFTLN